MKNSILALCAMILVITASAQYDPKALQSLDAMSKKYKAIPAFEANISYVLTNDVEKVNVEFNGMISVNADNLRLALPEL